MKKTVAGLAIVVLASLLQVEAAPSYRLVWEDHFDGTNVNEKCWSKIPRGTSPWNRHMSGHDSLYEVKDGKLVLWGRENKGLDPKDSAPYLTGGLYTHGKVTVGYGKVEVRAKLQAAKGAWPAIWMLADKEKWPDGGEIDILERLNHDAFGHQTVHSYYTLALKGKDPPQHGTGVIDPDGYNTYAVEILPDKLILSINGKRNLVYPRIKTDKKGQFPFGQPAYLLIDMQLGGSWVGKIDPKELPVKMEIDWVKFYELADENEKSAIPDEVVPGQAEKAPAYRLVWEDQFEGTNFDAKCWSKIPRGTHPWNLHMSGHDSLYEVKDGNLVLWGRKNKGLVPKDSAPYLTGGLYTHGKVTVGYGKVEVRAKLQAAKGAWPAIWMLPDKVKWPEGGEIDIMERLNHDDFVYQTLHTYYSYILKEKNPWNRGTGSIDPDGFNTYAVEILPDKVILSVNGKASCVYPKIQTDKKGQFPFGLPSYLMIDMQLGGDWAGEIDPEELPVKMEIDWVKFYELQK